MAAGTFPDRYMESSSSIKDLPPMLRLQLLLALNMRLLTQVPIFKGCDTRTIILIVQRMKSAIFCPGEFVVRQGAPTKALLMIRRGLMHVVLFDWDRVGTDDFWALIQLDDYLDGRRHLLQLELDVLQGNPETEQVTGHVQIELSAK